MLQPHLLHVKAMSAMRGRTWLMRVTVPLRVASLPAVAQGWECMSFRMWLVLWWANHGVEQRPGSAQPGTAQQTA